MQIIRTYDDHLVSLLNQEIQQLHVGMLPEHFKEYDDVAVREFYKEVMKSSNYQFYIVEEDEIALGYVWIELKEYEENVFRRSYKSIYVHQLNITESHRNKGLGSFLMNKVYEIAKLNYITKVELDYWSINDIAKKFYQKNGFTTYREFIYKDL